MAEGGFNLPTRKIPQLCRYFIHGACYRGDSCQYVHDKSGSAPTNNICKYFQRGKCSYGDRCRYDHVKAGGGQNSTQSNSGHQPRDKETESKPRWASSPRRNDDRDRVQTSMVTLRKGGGGGGGQQQTKAAPTSQDRKMKLDESSVHAAEFIPGQTFYAGATYAKATTKKDERTSKRLPVEEPLPPKDLKDSDLLCPYFAHGHCPYADDCSYQHGDVCDYCQFPKLHPTDEAQRKQHTKECMEEMERDLEHSFAIKDSQDKECCICLELVLEKAERLENGAAPDQRFGILENCSHCFCLSCIRRWRGDKSFGKNVRACPICRVPSNFVTPSSVWVEDEEKKKKFIQDYKDALSTKPCQYFKKGKGRCPFNERCFYKHAYPDGTIAEPRPNKPRRRVNAEGEMSAMEAVSLWDFLERRDDGFISLEDELSLYLLGILGDSDDDDDNDYYSHLWFDGISSSDTDSDFGF